MWDWKSLCSVGSSFGDIQKRTARSTPIVNIPSVFNTHLSNPCSFHDSICRHDQHAASARYRPTYSFGCITLLLPMLGGSRQTLQNSATSFLQAHPACLSQSGHLCQSQQKLVASDGTVGINLKMGRDLVIFLSHMTFQRTIQRSRLPLHIPHDRLRNTIGGMFAN